MASDRAPGGAGARGPEGPGAPAATTPAAPSGAPAGDRPRARLIVLVALGALAAWVLGLILWPFLPALVTSGAIAALVYPAHRRVERRLGRPAVAAFLDTVLILVIGLIPLLGLSLLLADQIVAGIDAVARTSAGLLAPEGRVSSALAAVAAYLGIDTAGFSTLLSDQLRQLANTLAGRTLSFLSGFGGWLLQAGAAIFTLYYLPRDGSSVVRTIRWLIPLDPAQSERLVERAGDVIYATIYGNVLVAIAQGAIGGLAFWIIGLPAAALWGTVMGLLSLLPVIGPPFVWLPAAVFLLLDGAVGAGVALLAIGALIISTVDNVLRAILVSDRAQLHPLVVFFSVLGGLLLFGAAGIIVGPVVFVLALTLIEMARVALDPGGEAQLEGGLLAFRPGGDRTPHG